MTDNHAFERFVADHLADDGSGTVHAERLAALIEERTGERRQRPRWLALIKEPPMRTNSHLAVGSPTVRVAAVLVATMLLAVALAAAGAGAQQLLAANGPIVVAQDGSGTYATITQAVAAADDGDEILVKPGTYAEVVVIDKDITLRGDGEREEVVLEFGSDGPMLPSWSGPVPYGAMLVDTEATISDLTVRGPNAAMAFVIVGGAPTLERVANDLEGDFAGRAQLSIVPLHSAGATVRDSLLDGPIWAGDVGTIAEYEDITGSGVWVAEDNTIDGGIWMEVADGSSFVRNASTDGGGFEFGGGTGVLVAENTTASIELDERSRDYTIRDNVVQGDSSDEPAIVLGSGSDVVEGNAISGAPVGIRVPAGATPTISGNALAGHGVAIEVLGTEGSIVIEGNRFCGNEQDLVVPDGSSLSLDPSNEVCEDGATE